MAPFPCKGVNMMGMIHGWVRASYSTHETWHYRSGYILGKSCYDMIWYDMIMSVAFDRSASSSMEKEPRNPMLTNFNVDPCNRTSLWFLLNKFPFFACIYSKVCADIILISDMWDKDSLISHLKSFSSTLKTPLFCSSSLFFGTWTHISLFWWNFKTWSLKDRKNLSNLEVFMKVCCNNFMIKSLLAVLIWIKIIGLLYHPFLLQKSTWKMSSEFNRVFFLQLLRRPRAWHLEPSLSVYDCWREQWTK